MAGATYGQGSGGTFRVVSPDDSPGMADRLCPHEKQKKEEPGGEGAGETRSARRSQEEPAGASYKEHKVNLSTSTQFICTWHILALVLEAIAVYLHFNMRGCT